MEISPDSYKMDAEGHKWKNPNTGNVLEPGESDIDGTTYRDLVDKVIPNFVNMHNKQMQTDWNSTHKTYPDDKIAEVKSVFQGVFDRDAKSFTENVDAGVDECVILLKKMYTYLKSGPKKRKLVEKFDGATAKEVCNAYTTFKRIFEGANGATELARNL